MPRQSHQHDHIPTAISGGSVVDASVDLQPLTNYSVQPDGKVDDRLGGKIESEEPIRSKFIGDERVAAQHACAERCPPELSSGAWFGRGQVQ